MPPTLRSTTAQRTDIVAVQVLDAYASECATLVVQAESDKMWMIVERDHEPHLAVNLTGPVREFLRRNLHLVDVDPDTTTATRRA